MENNVDNILNEIKGSTKEKKIAIKKKAITKTKKIKPKINNIESIQSLKDEITKAKYNNSERVYIDENVSFSLNILKFQTKIKKSDLISFAIENFIKTYPELSKILKNI